jgi:hypothetical protein
MGDPYAYYKQSIAAEDIPSLLAKESERVKSFFPFQTDADFKKFIADNRGQAPQKAATAGAIAQAVQNIAKQKPSNLRPPVNWVYDSDVFGGSYGEKFDNLKNIILNDPSIVKDILVAPAGAGKTTYAAKLGYKPITNFEDIHEGDRVLLLSASRLAKEGGFSTYFQQQLDAVNKTGGKKFFGELPNELITQRRQLRAQSGVARGLNAPLRESDFEQMLMSQGFKSLSLASNGFIPNFAFENFQIADERQKMVLKLLNEDPSRSLQDIADNLNIAYPDRKQKITKNEVRQILGKARRFFEQGKFKDINLSTGAKERLDRMVFDGFVPNFAEGRFNLSTIRFLMKTGAKLSSSVLNPKTLLNFASGKGKVEDLVDPLFKFLKNPSEVINSEQDLQNAKSLVKIIFGNEKTREMAASRLGPLLDESSYELNEQRKSLRYKIDVGAYKDQEYINYSDFLRYRLLGGQKEFEEFSLGSGREPALIKNKDGSYRFNPKEFSGERELESIYQSADSAFSNAPGYGVRKIGPEENVPGPNPFLGYTIKLGGFIGNLGRKGKAVRYEDRWDVDLHSTERDILNEFFKDHSQDLDARRERANNRIQNEFPDRSYNGDINSLIAKELVSSIPGARPVVFKGIARIPKNKRFKFSDGFIPNFASENAIRTMQEIIARAEGSNDPRLINEANVAKEKLKKLTGSEGGINFLNSISDIDVPELDLQSQLNNIRVAYTDTKGEMRRGTAPLSSLEQIIQVLRQKRHKEISILGAGLPGIKERLAALGIKDSEYQVSGGYEYFPLNQFGGFIPNFAKLGLNNQRLTQYNRFSKTVKNLKNQQAYKGKVQDEGKIVDQLTIPNIQVEKLNVDSDEFRRAAKRTKELRSEISKAIQAEGKAFETGIKKKYPQLKFTSNNEEIKFGSSSALDFVDDKTVVEAKAGNYNFQNVEEKFFRFPFENINNPNISKDIAPQFWGDKADNVKLYQNEILKLITAPESIDKESLYRIPAGARKQTAIENMAANMGFIPNFANAIALNKRYEFDGKYDSLNGKKRFNDFVKANSTDNIIPAFVGPNGVFYHHSIPSHEGLVRQFGLTSYDLENSIKAFIQNGVLTIPNLEETFQMQGKLRSQSLIDYAAKSTRNHLKESGLTNIIEKTKKNEKNVFFKELPQSEVFAAFNSLKNASWNDFSEEKTYQKIESLPLDKAREIIGLLEAKMDNRIGDFVPDNNTAQAQKNFISDVARVKADLQQILQEKEKASQELKKLKGQFGIGAGFSGASSFSKGFIPNFATGYLSDVMSLESNLSNNAAVLDTTTGPYPFIRNTSQSNFAAAISDHGGEKKALADSITNQTNAGLLSSRGMIPNFAPGMPPVVSGAPSQQLMTLQDEYALNMDLLAETLKQLRTNLQLSDKEIKTLTKEAKNLAATLDTQEASIKQMGGPITSVRESGKNIAEAGKRSGLQRAAGTFANLGNNIGFTLIAPLVAGQIQQLIEGNKERFEQSQNQRFASAAIGSGLSTLSTGATIGGLLAPILGPLAPFGPAVGAGAAAIISLTSAALGASDSLEDLQKKSEKYDRQTQETVGAGKNIIDTFKSLGSLDPNSLEFFDANQKLQDYFVKISETGLDQKFQKAGTDVELMTQAIKEYEMERVDEAKRLREDQQRKSRESVSIEEIGKAGLLRTQDRIEKRYMRQFVATPEQIQLYGKNVTEGQVPFNQQQFQNVTYDVNLGKEIVSQGVAGEENRRKILAQNSQLFEDLGKVESAMGKNFESFVKEFRDQANDDLRAGGYLGVFNEGYISEILNKYEIKGIDSKKFADQLQLIATESGDYGRFIVDNFDTILTGIKEGKYKTPKEAAKQLAAEVQQAQESIRQILFKNTQDIANGLTNVAIELEKYEFDKTIGKLGLEKSASLINTALGAIGKNIFDGFKAQFDLLTAQTQFQQGKQQLGFDAANFEKGLTLQLQQQRLEQQNKLIPVLREALGDNQQKNIQSFIDEFQRTGTLRSALELKTGELKGGEEGKRKLQDFQRTVESENRITAVKQDNSRKIFTSEQVYANLTLELNKKIAEEEYKLNEGRYQYALKEKALLDSIQLSAQKAQIDTQAAIEALRLPAQSPYFKLGAGEFGRQDINRGIEQRVFQEQIAGQAKQAIADAQIADVQRQVLEANSAATINNTTAIEALINSLTKTAAAEFESQKQQIAIIDKQIENIPSSVESLESIRSGISDSALEKDPSLPEKERQATIEKERKRLQLQKEQITSSQSYARNQAVYQIQQQQIERRAAQAAAASQTVNLRDITGGIPLSQISNPVEFLKQKQIEEQQRLTDLENQRAAETDLNKRAALDKQIEAQRTAINKLDAVNYDIQQKINNEKLKQKQLDEDRLKRGKFLTGVQQGFDEIVSQSQNFEQNFGKTAVMSFRDGLAGAIDAAMNKTDDLGAALMEVASGFLRTMQQALNQQIANNLIMGIGSAFPSATGINAQSFARRRGGIIRAQNGIYVPSMAGGNGMGIQDRGRTGDVNPALLEDGEYVLNRNAVAALGGPSVLDSLNFGQFPRFANGGQNTGSLSANANFNEPFSQLSEFGKEQSPEYRNYLDRLRDQWEKDQAKKKQRRAFINQLIMTGVSAAFSAGLGAFARPAVSSQGTSSLNSMFSKGEVGFSYDNFVKPSPTSLSQLSYSDISAPRINDLSSSGISINPYRQKGGLMRFASGGYLPYGNRLNDTIPALLSGGEYIVNSRSVRKYGVGGMNRINSGVARFEDGGLVGDPGNQNNTPGNVESSNSNNVSINITVNNNGGSSSEQESSNGGLDAQDKDNQLGQRIKQAVLQVITDEQRTGGLLDSTKKK